MPPNNYLANWKGVDMKTYPTKLGYFYRHSWWIFKAQLMILLVLYKLLLIFTKLALLV